MYGTVARMLVKPGKIDALKAISDGPGARKHPGMVTGYVFKTDRTADEVVMVAIFKDRESYHANAQSPEQDAEYKEMRELLQEDPEWIDGEVIQTMSS